MDDFKPPQIYDLGDPVVLAKRRKLLGKNRKQGIVRRIPKDKIGQIYAN